MALRCDFSSLLHGSWSSLWWSLPRTIELVGFKTERESWQTTTLVVDIQWWLTDNDGRQTMMVDKIDNDGGKAKPRLYTSNGGLHLFHWNECDACLPGQKSPLLPKFFILYKSKQNGSYNNKFYCRWIFSRIECVKVILFFQVEYCLGIKRDIVLEDYDDGDDEVPLLSPSVLSSDAMCHPLCQCARCLLIEKVTANICWKQWPKNLHQEKCGDNVWQHIRRSL